MARGKAAILALALLLGGCGRPDERLVVYTAAESDQLSAYAAAFRRAHPEISLVWVRESTGVVAARLLAERKNPRADVVFALAVTSLDQIDKAGLIAPYAPRGEAVLKPRFRDPRRPPHWFGTALFGSIICVNTRQVARQHLPVPRSWEDLTRPEYRGQIEMPDPTSSGTGLLTVTAWLQLMGETKGWDYMRRLDPNIAEYVHSGSKPCRDVARGEAPIGIGLDSRAIIAKRQGLPVEIVVPTEGMSWDFEASGLVRGARHKEAAQTFLDWAASPDAMALYGRNYVEVSGPGGPPPPEGAPLDIRDHFAPLSTAWASDNRDRVLARWSRDFTRKSGVRP